MNAAPENPVTTRVRWWVLGLPDATLIWNKFGVCDQFSAWKQSSGG